MWLSKCVTSSLRSCDGDWLCTGGLMYFLYSFQGDWAARALPKLWEGEINCNDIKEFGPKCRFPWEEVLSTVPTSATVASAGAWESLVLGCGGLNLLLPSFAVKAPTASSESAQEHTSLFHPARTWEGRKCKVPCSHKWVRHCSVYVFN